MSDLETKRARPLVKLLEILVILAMTALVIDVLLGVGTRQLGTLKFWVMDRWSISLGFLPEGQIKWSEELARFLMVWASLLGAALAFERRAHLGVDFFASKFHPSTRKLAQSVAHLLVMAFALLILIKGGVTVVDHARNSGQITPALGLRKWVVYLVVPVSGVFVILFTIENMIADLRRNDLDKEVSE